MSTDADRDQASIAPGSRVYVRWGLDVVPGFVIDRYDSPVGTRVVVTLDRQSPPDQEAITVTVPASEVEASDSTDLDAPGAWLNRAVYERELQHALRRILRPAGYKGALEFVRVDDRRYDYIIDLPPAPPIIVEVKYWTANHTISKQHTERLIRQFGMIEYSAGLLVSNRPISDHASHQLLKARITAVHWRSSKDDGLLEQAVLEAFSLRRESA